MFKKILIFTSIFLSVNAQLIVNTQYGPIRGAERVSQLNTTFLSFQRIPYMQPPVSSIRIKLCNEFL
jgi:hypothetical protein